MILLALYLIAHGMHWNGLSWHCAFSKSQSGMAIRHQVIGAADPSPPRMLKDDLLLSLGLVLPLSCIFCESLLLGVATALARGHYHIQGPGFTPDGETIVRCHRKLVFQDIRSPSST